MNQDQIELEKIKIEYDMSKWEVYIISSSVLVSSILVFLTISQVMVLPYWLIFILFFGAILLFTGIYLYPHFEREKIFLKRLNDLKEKSKSRKSEVRKS